MVSGLRGSTYEERLRELQLLSLADRRTQYDLIQTIKIIKDIDDVNVNIWFKLDPARLTRITSHPLNICANNPRCEIRKKNFFSNRVVF